MRARSVWSSVGLLSTALLVGSVAATACTAGGDAQSGAFSNGEGAAGATQPSGSGSPGGGSGEGGIHFTGGTGGDTGEGGGCAADEKQAEQVPLDMYIMLDQSTSMGGTVDKWTPVTDALKTFVQQPEASGIGVGIQYFGQPPGGTTCPAICTNTAQCNGKGPCVKFGPLGYCKKCDLSGESCDAADYANPEVEIAPLPGSASAILSSIDQHEPSTDTPTLPALQGAVQHAHEWAVAHPDHVVIVVFATDGEPSSSCNDNIDDINQAAENGVTGSPSVKTFVIGIGDVAVLDGIAAAGGTDHAFIVNSGPNVGDDFLDAMNTIRGTALPCSYKIPVPDTGVPDYNRVNVKYTPGGTATGNVIPKVNDAASCPPTGDAWYYDDNASPTLIQMCPGTCQTLKTDKDGKVNILTGCKTILQ